jgi:hypothetical protein
VGKEMIVALELVFARVTIAPAVAESRDDRVASVEQHLALELGGGVEQRNDVAE